MVKLTRSLLAEIANNRDLTSLEKLDASNRDISELGRLRECPQLIRLDLSRNQLTSLEGISVAKKLKWFSAASNQIASLEPVTGLPDLQVLNLGHNKLTGKVTVDSSLTQLGALILNDNAITSVKGLAQLPQLNTLVLKNAEVASLGKSLRKSTGLEKLSMAHNGLAELGDSLAACGALLELRLSHNELTRLPSELSKNGLLKILDVGANAIVNWEGVQVLKQLPLLRNLTLKGCPLCSLPDYPARLLKMLPQLEVLDGRRIAGPGPVPAPSGGAVAQAGSADEMGQPAVTRMPLPAKRAERRKLLEGAGAAAGLVGIAGKKAERDGKSKSGEEGEGGLGVGNGANTGEGEGVGSKAGAGSSELQPKKKRRKLDQNDDVSGPASKKAVEAGGGAHELASRGAEEDLRKPAKKAKKRKEQVPLKQYEHLGSYEEDALPVAPADTEAAVGKVKKGKKEKKRDEEGGADDAGRGTREGPLARAGVSASGQPHTAAKGMLRNAAKGTAAAPAQALASDDDGEDPSTAGPERTGVVAVIDQAGTVGKRKGEVGKKGKKAKRADPGGETATTATGALRGAAAVRLLAESWGGAEVGTGSVASAWS